MNTPLLFAPMEKSQVKNYEDLSFLILQLKEDRMLREEEFKGQFNRLIESFNPITILKTSLFKLAQEKNLLMEVGKVGLIVGSHFLIDRILGKFKSIKGFLSSVLVENIATKLIEDNTSKIISGIDNQITYRESEN